MNFIYQHQPSVCVEIGTFGGSTSFPLLAALDYLKMGQLTTIDAWNNQEALLGLAPNDSNYKWWSQVNFEAVYQSFLVNLVKTHLKNRCKIIRLPSRKAAGQFEAESIDLLYIDGNFSTNGSLNDVTDYFCKVKSGGYIWLNETRSPAKFPSITYLMRHTRWLKDESIENRCLVFQKL